MTDLRSERAAARVTAEEEAALRAGYMPNRPDYIVPRLLAALDAARDRTMLFDELRGAVIDLPVGTILPGWVTKEAVIAMIDRIEAEAR